MGCGRLGLIHSAARHANVCIDLMFLRHDLNSEDLST